VRTNKQKKAKQMITSFFTRSSVPSPKQILYFNPMKLSDRTTDVILIKKNANGFVFINH